MIFQRAIRREFTQSAAGVFVALFAILMTTQLIRLLGDAAEGAIAPEAVAALLGFAALNYIPTLLALSSFIAILLALSRSYRDSEMVVWFSCGVPLTAWLRPVLVFVLPLVLAITALSFFVSPWALSKSAEYRGNLQTRRDAGQVTPGAFQESSSGERVIFVEGVSDDERYVKNVFVSAMQNQRLGVTMAATGHQEFAENGDRFIVLQNGRRYEMQPGSAEFRIMEYARYAVRVETKEARGIERTPRNMPTLDLIANAGESRAYQAELLWRIGMPLSAILLAMLAIPLSFVNPRAGRSANFLLALFVYMVYNNLMTVGQAWVASGRISFLAGLAGVHLFMACLLPLLFFRRIAVFSFPRFSGQRADDRPPDAVPRQDFPVDAKPAAAPSLPPRRGVFFHPALPIKIHHRYLAREVAAGVLLVLVAFLALFSFFDMITEVKSVGSNELYQLHHAIFFVLLRIPGRIYELMPIAVLIGALYALSSLARHSEITVLRASGMSTKDLLGSLLVVAAVFALATFLVGEFVAPPVERAAQRLKLQGKGKAVAQELDSGLWVRDERSFINVRTVLPDTRLVGVRIYDFDEISRLRSVTEAEEGVYEPPANWRLSGVTRSIIEDDSARLTRLPDMEWRSALNPDILSVLMVSPEKMSLTHLSAYTRHLTENKQKTQRYDIAMWKKVIYPLASLVMAALALPFGYTHNRVSGVSLKIFSGVMIGVFFHMLNGLFSNLGAINSWSPFLSAIAPSALFMLAAVALIGWFERR